MIIRKVHLSNIRSYVDQDIELGEGITLFEGDIGSGKTTLLMAIDFALFGNSTKEFYERLLRKGAPRGYVEVVFEHEGETYTIHRALEKKGDKIVNPESYVLTPEGKIKLTSTQVRNYVLRLMGVDVESTRRKSLPVVKYAIYTPQETMKEILEGGDEDRLEVIRKIFKLDEYKVAVDNAEEVGRTLQMDGRTSKAKLEEISRIREDIEKKMEDIKAIEDEILKLKEEYGEAIKILEEKKREWEDVQNLRKKYESLRVRIGSLEANLNALRDTLKSERGELEDIERMKSRLREIENKALEYEEYESKKADLEEKFKRLKDLEVKYTAVMERIRSLKEKVSKIEDLKNEISELSKRESRLKEMISEIDELEERYKEIEDERTTVRGRIQSITSKIGELEEELESIKSLGGVCPKCKRPLTEEHKNKLIKETLDKIEDLKRTLSSLARKEALLKKEQRDIRKRMEELRSLQRELAALGERIRNVKMELVEAERAREEIEKMRGSIPQFSREELERVSIELKEVSKNVESLRALWNEYTALKKGIEREEILRKRMSEHEEKITSLEKEIQKMQEGIESLGYDENLYRSIGESYRSAGERVSSLKSKISEKERFVVELKEDIKRRERTVEELERDFELLRIRGEFGEWLRRDFVDALKDIENLRLLAINEEFRSLFEEWFYELLGESDYEPWIDEKFRPVIRYQRFDMPLSTLSGGERTSIALAYRLALNTMVKKTLGLRSNLLILDEPTDGFSKDQLYKLKDVFDKMETDQVIIVSHEKELMNLADVVFHVEKVNGISRIRRV